jgi:heptosyltransferase-2
MKINRIVSRIISNIKEISIKEPIRFLMRPIGKRFENLFKREFSKREIKKILVFQTGGIGDILNVFPLIKILDSEFPHSKINTLTEFDPDIFQLMRNNNAIDETIMFNSEMSFFKKMKLFYNLRNSAYDLVISPSRGRGMVECSIITFIIGKKWRVGFFKDGVGFLYTNTVNFKYNLPIFQQNISLLKSIGMHVNNKNIELRVPDEDLLFAQDILKEVKEQERILIAISPTAASLQKLKEWPIDNFIKLSKSLIEELNAFIILLGSKKDYERLKYFEQSVDEKNYIINLSGKTNLLQTTAIIKNCNLFIGNDSGLLHIANALNIPSIGIFGPTSPEQVLSRMSHVIIVRNQSPCSPCYLHQPYFKIKCANNNICLKNITVEDVFKSIGKLIRK